MKSLKPVLLQELKNTLAKALFQFRIFRETEAITSLSRGERIVSLLSKYDILYPERHFPTEDVYKIWQELHEYLELEKTSLRDEYIKINIRKDLKIHLERKDSGNE